MYYNTNEMEETGVSDYYYPLIGWIKHFITRNYSLSIKALNTLSNGEITENLENRNNVSCILKGEL